MYEFLFVCYDSIETYLANDPDWGIVVKAETRDAALAALEGEQIPTHIWTSAFPTKFNLKFHWHSLAKSWHHL